MRYPPDPRGLTKSMSPAYFLFAALFLLSLPGAKAAEEANLPHPSGAYTDEERDIKEALDAHFIKMGSIAYIVKGTLLYLYRRARSKHYNINSLGFRGGEVKSKKKNAFRVAVLGGSTVFGVLQSDVQTIPSFLEKRLRQIYPDRDVQVYNLGIEGYTFQREIALIRHLEARIDPDLVIFYHGWNDMSMACRIDYKDLVPFSGDDEAYFARAQRGDSLQKAIMGMSGRIWNKMAGRAWWKSGPPNLGARKALFVDKYLQYLREVKAHFAKKSVTVLVVLQPALATRTNATPRERELADSVRFDYPGNLDFINMCIAGLRASDEFKNGELHDISGIFDEYPGELYRDQVHINDAGNKIVAERLAALVLETAGPDPAR